MLEEMLKLMQDMHLRIQVMQEQIELLQQQDELVSQQEACKIIGVKDNTLRAMEERGEIQRRYGKSGVVRYSKLDLLQGKKQILKVA